MRIDESKLMSLDFYFINEIKEDLYEIIYAKDISESEGEGEILYNYNEIAFWSKENCDRRHVISFDDILMEGLVF